jgi:hypothetical protein
VSAEALDYHESNIAIEKASVMWEDLSRTFQDAIVVTKMLRVRYL